MRYWVTDASGSKGRTLHADSPQNAAAAAVVSGAFASDTTLYIRWNVRTTRSGDFLSADLLVVTPTGADVEPAPDTEVPVAKAPEVELAPTPKPTPPPAVAPPPPVEVAPAAVAPKAADAPVPASNTPPAKPAPAPTT